MLFRSGPRRWTSSSLQEGILERDDSDDEIALRDTTALILLAAHLSTVRSDPPVLLPSPRSRLLCSFVGPSLESITSISRSGIPFHCYQVALLHSCWMSGRVSNR